jgi:hypothetical protein
MEEDVTLAELERRIRAMPDSGDSVHLRLSRGRWELKYYRKKGDRPSIAYGATLDQLAERLIEAGWL